MMFCAVFCTETTVAQIATPRQDSMSLVCTDSLIAVLTAFVSSPAVGTCLLNGLNGMGKEHGYGGLPSGVMTWHWVQVAC